MGTVFFEGNEYKLTQDAYVDGPVDGTPFFRVSAVDTDGNDCEVRWEVIEGKEDVEDMQEMCDWDRPVIVDIF